MEAGAVMSRILLAVMQTGLPTSITNGSDDNNSTSSLEESSEKTVHFFRQFLPDVDPAVERSS